VTSRFHKQPRLSTHIQTVADKQFHSPACRHDIDHKAPRKPVVRKMYGMFFYLPQDHPAFINSVQTQQQKWHLISASPWQALSEHSQYF